MAHKKKIIMAVVLLALIGGGYFVYRNMFDWIRLQAERVASDSLGVDVGIGSIDASFRNKTVRIKNIEIGNPKGYGMGDALKFGDIEIVADVLSRDRIVIKKVSVTDNEINLEMKGSKSNLNALSSGIKSGGGQPKSEESAKAPTLNIEDLVIDKTKLTVKSNLVKSQGDITVPTIRLKNVGQNNNQATAVVAQIARAVLNEALSAAAKNGVLQNLSKAGVDTLKGGLKTGTEGFKKSLEGIGF